MFKDCLFEGNIPPTVPPPQPPKIIRVEAQKNFEVGPDKTIIIKKGERFEVHPDENDQFFVKLTIGSFGACTLTSTEWVTV